MLMVAFRSDVKFRTRPADVRVVLWPEMSISAWGMISIVIGGGVVICLRAVAGRAEQLQEVQQLRQRLQELRQDMARRRRANVTEIEAGSGDAEVPIVVPVIDDVMEPMPQRRAA